MPNLSQYICSLFEGVSDAFGLSWKAFQCTRAWTPVDRSAVSKLRLPTQQKGQTTSLMISTIARLVLPPAMAAMAVARPRARILTLAEQCSHRALPCTPNEATVMSRAREQALSAYRGSPVQFLCDWRVREQPQQAKKLV